MKMNGFAQTGALLRVAFRYDRLKLGLWILGITSFVAMMAAGVEQLFASQQELEQAAMVFAQNPVMRLFTLPAEASHGGFIMLRGYVIFAVLAALMSIMAITRHTRQNEETGRSELIGSSAVGRYSSLTAALITVVMAQAILAVTITAVLIAADLEAASALAAALAITGIGVVFATIAAVTGQLSQTARGANGLAGIVLGAAYLLSAVGSVTGRVRADGVMVDPGWATWLSPLGWGQIMRPFAENNWWPLLLFVALGLMCVAVAYAIASRRDIGHGVLAARRGPARAAVTLSSPTGLAWRLQKGAFIAWTLSTAAAAAVFGAIADQFEELLSQIEGVGAVFGQAGSETMTESYIGAIAMVIAMLAAAFMVQILLRIRIEETTGRMAAVLATGVSKSRWLASYSAVALGNVTLLCVVAATVAGLTAALMAGDVDTYLRPTIEGSLMRLPAVFALSGFVLLLVGLWPRRASAFGWAALFVTILCGPIFGDLLDLPDWLKELSPLTHIGGVSVNADVLPVLLALLLLGAVWSLASLVWFRVRDISVA